MGVNKKLFEHIRQLKEKTEIKTKITDYERQQINNYGK